MCFETPGMVRFFVVTDQTSPAAAFFSACSITSPYDAASAALPPACSSARAASRSPSRCSGSGGLAEVASEADPSSSHRATIHSTCCTTVPVRLRLLVHSREWSSFPRETIDRE